MGIAKVAIIGRPNVGKSSLFNWLAGERVSVVDSVAGVTRDRVSFLLELPPDGKAAGEDDFGPAFPETDGREEKIAEGNEEDDFFPVELDAEETDSDDSEWNPADLDEEGLDEKGIGEEDADILAKKKGDAGKPGEDIGNEEEADDTPFSDVSRYIELTDTGGIGVVDKDDLSDDVERQIEFAIESADLILFVTDARSGVATLDQQVAERLRTLPIPVLLVANKSDDDVQERNAVEFERFGWGVIPVSAKQRRGRVRLMAEIEKAIPPEVFRSGGVEEDPILKVAIVGRRNVGKSSFVNTLAGSERVIASPVPGTTRDIVDVRFEMDGNPFLAIDTPGFLRKKSVGTDLDFYSLTRAERGIRRADVVFLFFDSSRRISKMDKQLVRLIEFHQRPVIFVVNKWDLMAPHMPTGRWGDYLRETFATSWYVPIAFITGINGKNVNKLLQYARRLHRQSRTRVSTNRLNKIVTAAMDYNPPPLFYHRKPKIYYATQAGISPPTIVLFCNMPDAFAPNWKRYLLSVFRDELPFGEVPIRLVFRKRESDDKSDEIDARRKS